MSVSPESDLGVSNSITATFYVNLTMPCNVQTICISYNQQQIDVHHALHIYIYIFVGLVVMKIHLKMNCFPSNLHLMASVIVYHLGRYPSQMPND